MVKALAPTLAPASGPADWAAAWRDRLRQQPVIAVIRSGQPAQGLAMAQAAAAGGLRWLEVTWTSDRPAETIAQIRQNLPHCNIGVGTIWDQTALANALAAGAQFAFSPMSDRSLIHWARDRQVPLVAGAMTPSEIMAAWQAGAAAVKLFPIHAVGGAAYLRALAPALPAIPLVPTGGVVAAQVPELLAAGAWAVGLSAGVFPRSAIEAGDWPAVTAAAQDLCNLATIARCHALAQAARPAPESLETHP